MKDRMKTAVKEYDRKYGLGSRAKDGQFTTYDLKTLLDMSNFDSYDLVTNALKAGFIIGLRKGKRDSRKRG